MAPPSEFEKKKAMSFTEIIIASKINVKAIELLINVYLHLQKFLCKIFNLLPLSYLLY